MVGDESKSNPAEASIPQVTIDDHLENLGPLVGGFVDLGRREVADVIGPPEVAHQRVDEPRCRNSAPRPVLRWDGDVEPASGTESGFVLDQPSKRRPSTRRLDPRHLCGILGTERVDPQSKQRVGKLRDLDTRPNNLAQTHDRSLRLIMPASCASLRSTKGYAGRRQSLIPANPRYTGAGSHRKNAERPPKGPPTSTS